MNRAEHLRLPALYPIIDVGNGDPDEPQRAVALVKNLAAALPKAGILQLRAKTLGAGPFVAIARTMVKILVPSKTALIINDRVDVAVASGASGVHLGDEDLPVTDARRILGERAIIGYSTHSIEDIVGTDHHGADYLGFGPVFASPTKAGAREARGVEALAAACQASRLPVVAIGGITIAAAPPLWAAGAASLAVISELAASDDPASLLRTYEGVKP